MRDLQPTRPLAASGALELWAGVECTVARVGERFRDQVVETGHRDRLDDLDRIAELGIRTLRYPILWETIAPDAAERREWKWHDARLARLRALGIRPIAGLIHHGSGPRRTNLLDLDFPALFARHAADVAQRYPWIDVYTPVNEPLTTARFSALYGHWYPHARDYGAFLRALVNQCRATVLAMQAIRRVNPAAQLLQTEDIGRTFSTPGLAYQADHENERRWLSLDLLFGRVTRAHPWWRIMRDHGIAAHELDEFVQHATPPDIVGINHYLTSDRFLDEDVARYPQHLAGGNGRDVYADAEAVRIPLPEADLGSAARLLEVWQRYGAPLAVTEVHHGCTRDEQLRWLAEVWQAADTLRLRGVDVRAVTLWTLFGTIDWNTLLTREAGIYEPGAYDVRGPQPRPTALAHAARALATEGSFDHPTLDRPGWWRRMARFYDPAKQHEEAVALGPARALLLVGNDGPTTRAFARLAAARGLACETIAPHGSASIDAVTTHQSAWAVIDLCFGSAASDGLASACADRGLAYVALSRDFVFDGRCDRPYLETDPVSPANARAAETAEHERRILRQHPRALLIRTGPILYSWAEHGAARRDLASGETCAASGCSVALTYLPDLVHVALDLLIDGDSGIRHLVNAGDMSALAHHPGWWLARIASGLSDRAGVANHALATARGDLMPPLSSALDRFHADCQMVDGGSLDEELATTDPDDGPRSDLVMREKDVALASDRPRQSA